jgi:hypothetical protein
VLHKRLVKLATQVNPHAPLRLPPHEPGMSGKVRQRGSRRAVQGVVDEAEARAQGVATKLVDG